MPLKVAEVVERFGKADSQYLMGTASADKRKSQSDAVLVGKGSEQCEGRNVSEPAGWKY